MRVFLPVLRTWCPLSFSRFPYGERITLTENEYGQRVGTHAPDNQGRATGRCVPVPDGTVDDAWSSPFDSRSELLERTSFSSSSNDGAITVRLIRFGILVATLAACSTNPPMTGTSGSAAPAVTVDAGALAGAVDTSGVFVFRGVPYAAPPVGDLRWRPPTPVAHWSGTRAANRLGKNCVQDQIYGDIDPFAAGPGF